MDSYVKSVTVDVNAEDNYTMVKAKQGDKINRKIAITLKKDGANFTPSGASQIWFRMEKPDGNIAIVKSTDSGSPITSVGNVYTVTLTEQCLTASGEAWCDLAFLDASGNTLSSAAFVMKIIPMPNGNSATSISEWTDLQQAIDDAERFADIVAFRTSGNYIQYTVDGSTWTNLVNVGAIGGDLQTQINTINNRFLMSTVSASNVNEFLLNACADFADKNVDRVCPVRYVWMNNGYYQGTMLLQGPNVFFTLSSNNGKIYYGSCDTSNRTLIVTDLDSDLNAVETAITKDNMSSRLFANAAVVADLNNCVYGSNGYNPSTANIPIANTYGTCYQFNAVTWIWQLAIDTNGNMYKRKNINNNGWTAWIRIMDDGSAIPIIHGGTGATDAWSAKTNLGAAVNTGTFVVATSGTVLSLPKGTAFFLLIEGGLYQMTCASAGNVIWMPIAQSSLPAGQVTVDTSVNQRIIITAPSYALRAYWICFVNQTITA